MSQIPVWFERKFDPAIPAEHLPYILVRLRGTPARIEEMLDGRPRDVLTAKPSGKWSAQEHAGHLLDLEELWAARLADFETSKTELTLADLTNRRTDEAGFNSQDLPGILAKFRRARRELVERAEKLSPEIYSRTLLHPRLRQPMRLVDHLFFVAEHDDHHLAHIWAIVSGWAPH